MRLSEIVVNVLGASTVDGAILFLPRVTLSRKDYEAVNKALEVMGGKWNKKAKGHTFDCDPSDLLENALRTGEIVDSKKEFQFFPTPDTIVKILMDKANLTPACLTLEPSAGTGAIAKELAKRLSRSDYLTLVELDPKKCAALRDLGIGIVYCQDFLRHRGYQYDRIVMNPPFSRLQDVAHVTHAFSLLAPRGRLVSVVSEGPFGRQDAKSVEFRELVDARGTSVRLHDSAFRESGTNVNTRIVTLERAA